MPNFSEDQWGGNKWMAIDINPADPIYLVPILIHLSSLYHFSIPKLIDTLDGYVAEFEIIGSKTIVFLDNYTLSIAFEKISVRDQILTALRSLPENYFDQKSK